MAMQGPRSPYREVVDEDNQDILATLDQRAWGAFQEAWAEAEFFDLPVVQGGLLRSLRQTGSIQAGHRKDLVQAIQGQRSPTIAMGVPVAQEAAKNGHEPRRPGL